MIVQHILLFVLVFYREVLLAWAYEIFLADALSHAGNHLLVQIHGLLDYRSIEQACVSYRHTTGAGRPAIYHGALLVRALVVGWVYGLSLRQLEARLYHDLVARWFIGYQPGDPLPDHTTLARFEYWLIENHPDLFFSDLLSQIDQRFPQERQLNQIGDTYAMLANAADEGLVQRIRHVCLRLVMECQDSLPDKFTFALQGFDWAALFGPKPEKLEIRTGKVGREERLERTVLAALNLRQRIDQLVEPYTSHQHQALRTWCQYLDKVLADEVKVERNVQNEPSRVTEIPMKAKGDFRVISATDPQATLRFHGDQAKPQLGYNVQVAVTTTGFIHESHAYTGAVPDQAGVAALITAQKERQERAGEPAQLPPKLIYDKAGGTGKTRADVQAASHGSTQLVAKAKEPLTAPNRLSPFDFQLSADGQALTCPNGQTSTLAYPFPTSYARNFAFHAHQCWKAKPPRQMQHADLTQRCPWWEKCRGEKCGPRRIQTVFISDYREQILAAEIYNQSECFWKEMKQRPLVERVIFELTHYNAARCCRRRGQPAADYQAKMCATAYNLKLLVRKLGRKTPKPRLAPLAG